MADNNCMHGATPIFDERTAIIAPDLSKVEFRIDAVTMSALQGKQFLGKAYEDPTKHLRHFIGISNSFNVPGVDSEALRRILFPYTLEGEAKEWLATQPPGSMTTWEEVVDKFLERYFSPAKTLKLIRAIACFDQESEESLAEAWERFKGLLRGCPHHGQSKEQTMRTFFGGLLDEVQESLNSTSKGLFLGNSYEEASEILEKYGSK